MLKVIKFCGVLRPTKFVTKGYFKIDPFHHWKMAIVRILAKSCKKYKTPCGFLNSLMMIALDSWSKSFENVILSKIRASMTPNWTFLTGKVYWERASWSGLECVIIPNQFFWFGIVFESCRLAHDFMMMKKESKFKRFFLRIFIFGNYCKMDWLICYFWSLGTRSLIGFLIKSCVPFTF